MKNAIKQQKKNVLQKLQNEPTTTKSIDFKVLKAKKHQFIVEEK